MKAIVLEHGFEQDIPDDLIEYLDEHKIDWQWFDMRERFWPKNRQSTFSFFAALPEGTEIYTHHVFVDYIYLEMMINFLHVLKDKKFKVHIMNYSLCENLVKYYEAYESDITPNTDEYNDSPKLRTEFKLEMNKKFIDVLQWHQLYHLTGYGKPVHLKSYDFIKKLYDERGY